MAKDAFSATGRRKEAVASVRIQEGKGKITVNGRDMNEYFGRETLVMVLQQPLKHTETTDRFDINIRTRGGGLSGQAGAARLGIARALIQYDEKLRPTLKSAGFLTRDPRMVERKNTGWLEHERDSSFPRDRFSNTTHVF